MTNKPAAIKRLYAALETDTPDIDELWADACKAHTKHPDLYQDWLPSFYDSIHKDRLLAQTDNLEALDSNIEIMPRGRFNLRLGRRNTGNFTSAILKKALSSKRTGNLHGIELHHHKKMSDAMFALLTNCKHLDELKALVFASIPTLRLDHVEALLEASCAVSLEKLHISHAIELGDGVIDLLLAAPHREKLKDLQLSDVGLTGNALEKLQTTSELPALTSLDITGNDRVDAASVVQLLESPFAAQLERFWVDSSVLSDDGARAIANSPNLRKIDTLALKNAGLSIEGVRALVASEHLPSLKSLMVWGKNVNYTDAEMEALQEEYAGKVQIV